MSYEIKTDKAGKFRFNLKAANGQIILSSEAYSDKSGALGGIASVQKYGPDSGNYDKKISSSGQPYFSLKAGNGQVIGSSEMYSSDAARDNGIASVQKNSPSTDIQEV
jgi:uncharacterized protein YegP (UPF0339 family)